MKRREDDLATLDDYLEVELEEAKLALKVAYNQFNHCDPEFVDFCILQIEASKAKLNAILKNLKQEDNTNEQNDYSNSSDFIAGVINRILGT